MLDFSKDAQNLYTKLQNMDISPLPPLEMAKIIGSPDMEHFVDRMILFASDIVSMCHIKPEYSLLDMGCGVGRLAIAFSHYLSSKGKYIGFDVWDEGIKWCEKNIGKKHNNFSFHFIDTNDNYYYQDKRKNLKNDLKLKFCDSNSIDVAFALSVFTHLTKEDSLQYFNELSRVIKPKGYAYLTFFVIDEYFHEFRQKTGKYSALKEEAPGVWHGYSGQGFFGGFEKRLLENMLTEAGFDIVRFEAGKWVDKPNSRLNQDLYLVQVK